MWKFGKKSGNLKKKVENFQIMGEKIVKLENFGNSKIWKHFVNLKTQKFGGKKIGKLEDLVIWRKKI